MFSSIGWGEILTIVVLGVIIVGPERLPGVIEDVRAAIFAARKAINNAKAELNGEFGEVSQEFEVLRGPINTAAQWGKMGPKAALTKALFDGDDSVWDDFDLRKNTAPASPAPPTQGFDYSQVYAQTTPESPAQPQPGVQQPDPQPPAHQSAPTKAKPGNSAQEQQRPEDGFSWADVT